MWCSSRNEDCVSNALDERVALDCIFSKQSSAQLFIQVPTLVVDGIVVRSDRFSNLRRNLKSAQPIKKLTAKSDQQPPLVCEYAHMACLEIPSNVTGGQRYKLFKKKKGTLGQKFFSARVVDLWNELDGSIVSVDNVTFKRMLGKLGY